MRVTVLFALCLAWGLSSTDAAAQGAPKPAPTGAAPTGAAPPPPPTVGVGVDASKAVPLAPDAIKKLKSGDPSQIKAGLDEVRMSGKGGASAVPAIAELLKSGLTLALTQAAIETLGDTETEGASDSVAWYVKHRNVGMRRAAVQALAKTKGAVAVKALRGALSDSDPAVRGLSATALGAMRAKDAVGDLFAALDHKVPEAAASIGMLCAGGECDKLASKLGNLPFDVVTSGLDQVLFRPSTDVSDDTKVKVIGRVRELGTGEANRFLREVQKKWPATWSQRVKQSIEQAVLATSGSPGGGGGQ
jgi:HEAT repeat protein